MYDRPSRREIPELFYLTTESWDDSKTGGNVLICQHGKHLILGQEDAFLLS